MSCVSVAVCSGLVIDNVASAQKLKGCNIINGILEIQIRGGSKSPNCTSSSYRPEICLTDILVFKCLVFFYVDKLLCLVYILMIPIYRADLLFFIVA